MTNRPIYIVGIDYYKHSFVLIDSPIYIQDDLIYDENLKIIQNKFSDSNIIPLYESESNPKILNKNNVYPTYFDYPFISSWISGLITIYAYYGNPYLFFISCVLSIIVLLYHYYMEENKIFNNLDCYLTKIFYMYYWISNFNKILKSTELIILNALLGICFYIPMKLSRVRSQCIHRSKSYIYTHSIFHLLASYILYRTNTSLIFYN